MITRLYADNFRCLVNFELRLSRTSLWMGENGSGKTTAFEVLYRLQQFLRGNLKVAGAFPSTDLTRSLDSRDQRFELDLKVEDGTYTYLLLIEHDEDRRRARIKEERLEFNERRLFYFQEGLAHLYRDDSSVGPQYPFDWTQSGISVLNERPENKRLTRFRREISRLIIAAIHPMNILRDSREEESALSRNMENFVSWYRFLSQEHQGSLFGLANELKQVLPGFDSFSVREAGEARVMKVLMNRADGQGRPLVYDFSELSDGQRVLVALYAVLYGLKSEGVSLFLDEPDNFMALREIQPWLNALSQEVGSGIEQVVLISHHPEIIDYMADPSGVWFERESTGYVRVSEASTLRTNGLRLSESIARGWQA